MNKRTKAFFLKWSGSRTGQEMSEKDLQKAWVTIAQDHLSPITNLLLLAVNTSNSRHILRVLTFVSFLELRLTFSLTCKCLSLFAPMQAV